jgi:hypothetical protein
VRDLFVLRQDLLHTMIPASGAGALCECHAEEYRMPESRVRKKAAYTPPPAKGNAVKPNGRLFLPTMVSLFVIALVWIVTFYVSQTQYPIPNIGYWNLAIGFGIAMTGFGMTMRWR